MISVNAASIVILFSLKSLDYVLDILVEPLLLLKVYQKAKDETFYHGRGISKLLKWSHFPDRRNITENIQDATR